MDHPGEADVPRPWMAAVAGRPAPVLAACGVGAFAAVSVGAIVSASVQPAGTFRDWVISAGRGFAYPSELALLVAAILLVFDGRHAGSYPGRRALSTAVWVGGLVGVLFDLAAAVGAGTSPAPTSFPASLAVATRSVETLGGVG
ncbi:MAG: hypothetical protein ACRDYY_17470, partial [Acidimicrobiales bacterium]